MNKIESINLIYRNPDVRGGRPCIVGTTIRVIDLVMAMNFRERGPDELAADYDLPMEKVHAALAYYYCNRAEIDADIRADIKRSDELVREYMDLQDLPDVSSLRFRLAVARAYAELNQEAVAGRAEAEFELAAQAN